MRKNLLLVFTLSFGVILSGCAGSSNSTNASGSGANQVVSKDTNVINKAIFTATPLIITFNKAELHKISDLTEEERNMANLSSGSKYYVDIEFSVKNPKSSMYGWNGFNTMLLDGEQIDILSENFGEIKGNEVQANATIKNNSIKIATNDKVKEIKLIPSEPLENNTVTGEEPEFSPNPIVIDLK